MRRLSILGVLVVLLLASSCGGGGKSSPTGTPGPNETPATGFTLPLRPEEPALYSINSDGSDLEKLFEEGDYLSFLIHPDGRRIAVTSWVGIDQTVVAYLVDLETGDRQEIERTRGSLSLARWSPDGKQLALISYPLTGTPDAGSGVVLYDVDSSEMRRIADSDSRIVYWSDDGRVLYLAQGYSPATLQRIALPSLDSSDPVPGLQFTDIAFSPDGLWVAIGSYASNSGTSPSSTYTIEVVRSDGTERRKLVDLPETFTGGGFAWSPDGTRLAYSHTTIAAGDVSGGIFVADLATGETTQVTNPDQGVDFGGNWSSDGARLLVLWHVCTQCDGPGSKAALAAADGSGEVPLPGTEEFLDGGSAWSPDGRQFVYAADKLYLADADGSNVRALVDMPGSGYSSVSWAGTERILFVRGAALPTTTYAVQPDGSDFDVLGVGVAVAPDGETIADYGKDGLVIRAGEDEPVVVTLSSLEQIGFSVDRPPSFFLWSPDSEWVAFTQGGPNGGTLLAVASRDGQVQLVRSGSWEGDLRWSPDSRRLAYWAGGAVWASPVAGGDAQRLADTSSVPSLDWSSDGEQLAYADTNRVMAVPADGAGQPRLLFDVPSGADFIQSLRWSPDGEGIAAISRDRLYVGEIEAGQATQIAVMGPAGFASVEWIEDGEVLAFGAAGSSEPPQTPGVYLIDASGGTPRLLVEPSGRQFEVVGRLDDGRILFTSNFVL